MIVTDPSPFTGAGKNRFLDEAAEKTNTDKGA